MISSLQLVWESGGSITHVWTRGDYNDDGLPKSEAEICVLPCDLDDLPKLGQCNSIGMPYLASAQPSQPLSTSCSSMLIHANAFRELLQPLSMQIIQVPHTSKAHVEVSHSLHSKTQRW